MSFVVGEDAAPEGWPVTNTETGAVQYAQSWAIAVLAAVCLEAGEFAEAQRLLSKPGDAAAAIREMRGHPRQQVGDAA